jgi:hypothetical protein
MWVPRPIWPTLPTFVYPLRIRLEAWELSRRHPTAQGHSRTSGIHTVTNIRIQVFIVFCIWEESYLGQRDRTS